jgi:hypothetical protein
MQLPQPVRVNAAEPRLLLAPATDDDEEGINCATSQRRSDAFGSSGTSLGVVRDRRAARRGMPARPNQLSDGVRYLNRFGPAVRRYRRTAMTTRMVWFFRSFQVTARPTARGVT